MARLTCACGCHQCHLVSGAPTYQVVATTVSLNHNASASQLRLMDVLRLSDLIASPIQKVT